MAKKSLERAGNAAVKNFDWRGIYQTSLTTEILRSERRRVTILSGLFVFAACVYTSLAFVPGSLTPRVPGPVSSPMAVDHLALRSGSGL